MAQTTSFAKAGELIGLSQSAVSAQMQRLEQALGRKLFERGPKSIQLSDAGRLLIPEAQSLIEQWRNLKYETTSDVGLIKLGAIHSVHTSILTPSIAAFCQQHSHWKIRVIPDISISLLAKVESGELDAAIIIKPSFALPEHLRWTSLAREPFCLMVPETTEVSNWSEAIHTHSFIRYYKGSFGGRIVDSFLRKHAIDIQDIIEIDDIQAMVDLVVRGVGAAFVPWNTTTPKGCRCIPLDDDEFYREIGVIATPHSLIQGHLDQLIESMQLNTKHTSDL